jgi:hypothetical protein
VANRQPGFGASATKSVFGGYCYVGDIVTKRPVGGWRVSCQTKKALRADHPLCPRCKEAHLVEHEPAEGSSELLGPITADTLKFNTTADGTATAVDVQAWGYQQ